MQVQWLEVVGLIGVTLVVTKGRVFDGLRSWLLRFVHGSNPLPWFGALLSCAMCSGVWVGFLWGLVAGRGLLEAILLGGIVSVTSWPVGEVLSMLELFVERRRPPSQTTVSEFLEARAAYRDERRAQLNAEGQPPNANMGADEAFAHLDAQDQNDEVELSDPKLIRALRDKEMQEKGEAA